MFVYLFQYYHMDSHTIVFSFESILGALQLFILSLPTPIPVGQKNLLTYLRAFIKPFEAPKTSVKIEIQIFFFL